MKKYFIETISLLMAGIMLCACLSDNTVPQEGAEESVPEASVSEGSVPEDSMLEESPAEESVPEGSVSEDSISDESVPEPAFEDPFTSEARAEMPVIDGTGEYKRSYVGLVRYLPEMQIEMSLWYQLRYRSTDGSLFFVRIKTDPTLLESEQERLLQNGYEVRLEKTFEGNVLFGYLTKEEVFDFPVLEGSSYEITYGGKTFAAWRRSDNECYEVKTMEDQNEVYAETFSESELCEIAEEAASQIFDQYTKEGRCWRDASGAALEVTDGKIIYRVGEHLFDEEGEKFRIWTKKGQGSAVEFVNHFIPFRKVRLGKESKYIVGPSREAFAEKMTYKIPYDENVVYFSFPQYLLVDPKKTVDSIDSLYYDYSCIELENFGVFGRMENGIVTEMICHFGRLTKMPERKKGQWADKETFMTTIGEKILYESNDPIYALLGSYDVRRSVYRSQVQWETYGNARFCYSTVFSDGEVYEPIYKMRIWNPSDQEYWLFYNLKTGEFKTQVLGSEKTDEEWMRSIGWIDDSQTIIIRYKWNEAPENYGWYDTYIAPLR